MVAVRNTSPMRARCRQQIRPCFALLLDSDVTVAPLNELAGPIFRVCCALSDAGNDAQDTGQFAHSVLRTRRRPINGLMRSPSIRVLMAKSGCTTGAANTTTYVAGDRTRPLSTPR